MEEENVLFYDNKNWFCVCDDGILFWKTTPDNQSSTIRSHSEPQIMQSKTM